MSAMLFKNSFNCLDYLVIGGKTFIKNPKCILIKYNLKNIPSHQESKYTTISETRKSGHLGKLSFLKKGPETPELNNLKDQF